MTEISMQTVHKHGDDYWKNDAPFVYRIKHFVILGRDSKCVCVYKKWIYATPIF